MSLINRRAARTCAASSAEAPRTFTCDWCGGTTGALPADTPPADRVCDACVNSRLLY